jgi:protein-S-isoprenylcysteine O-methyltransferase Ste14
MALDLKTRPNRLPWPPMIYATAVALAFLAQKAKPWPATLAATDRKLGLILLGLGLGLDLWAILTMRRAGTNILPNRGADKLLDHGPFAISRNPIYFGNTLAVLGLGVAANSVWVLLAGVAAAALVWAFAIRREEAHLALRFGADWQRYAARTPRWIGPASFRREPSA